ncbi:MAG TPA: hypothetical protein VK909_02790, partial [Anaerolineales bacterium]|nr:hypothetical protein [Anaerolineales bacterium]
NFAAIGSKFLNNLFVSLVCFAHIKLLNPGLRWCSAMHSYYPMNKRIVESLLTEQPVFFGRDFDKILF